MDDPPGYKLAIQAQYDQLYGGISALEARTRHLALAPYLGRVLTALDLPDEGYHLDLGCGDGAATLAIARERHDMTIVGLDTSTKALKLARQLAQLEGLGNANFVEGDVESPPDAMFERASALSVFNLVPDKRAALAAWRQVIMPHGRLVITDAFDTRTPGTMNAGAASLDGLAQLARETGWRIIAREDLTHLIAKLHTRHAWSWPEYIREGYRYTLVVLT